MRDRLINAIFIVCGESENLKMVAEERGCIGSK